MRVGLDTSHPPPYPAGMGTPKDLITTTEARQLLNVSRSKMARLVSEGVLPHYVKPLDKRFKYVSRADVERLKEARAA